MKPSATIADGKHKPQHERVIAAGFLRRLRKLGKWMLVALLVLAAIIYCPFWDTAAPDVGDLRLVPAAVLPEDNAYTYFLQATNAFCPPTEFSYYRYTKGDPVDEALVYACITNNQETLDWIRRGVECPDCQLPGVAGRALGPDRGIPNASFFGIGRVIAIQSRFERLQGRSAEATDACLLLLRFGNHLHAGSVCNLDFMIGNAMVHTGLGQAEALSRDHRCEAQDRARLATALANLTPTETVLDNVIRGEYVVLANILDRLPQTMAASLWYVGDGFWNRMRIKVYRSIFIPSYFMQNNRTKHIIADDSRQVITHVSSVYADSPSWNDIRSGADVRGRLPFANTLGRWIVAMFSRVSLEYACQLKYRTESSIAGIRLILACRAFEEQMARLPDTLDELVPAFMPSVPRDPFDGQPFRYAAERRIVYSVGKNLTDDDGSDERQGAGWGRPKDLIFELSKPPGAP